MWKGITPRLQHKGAQGTSRHCLRPDPVKPLLSIKQPLASRHSPASKTPSKGTGQLDTVLVKAEGAHCTAHFGGQLSICVRSPAKSCCRKHMLDGQN